ncbi:flagellar assembly protein FliW [Cytobacillus firmus]|uniref:flagellar assembly protein FliW n=1 Tax=Cytobacillus firmus TaxID=1399 RepID=UPI00077CC07C|nr:flagellar assembly protein FliW [Cytobacillus firmus]MBG9544722.1 flagellar assembly protein FliW [Cytobacillus firmus]MBG9553999.1 flagellar assembly protein FliW [Cytobacillus firmus]MBG9558469.1 flagellar assembly protein FliW [Cytobacillus firmus]MBG9576988.1 flagellar assembly protein FliW [Cytobacillus firmus]MEC1894361.1 flagellar assembly protein FliW [Cytobacillus firmus]
MQIKTKYHGEVEIQETDILHFEKGLPGFPDESYFTLIDLTDDHLYQVLQSTKEPEIGFIVTDPFFFKQDYDFKLEDAIVNSLQIQEAKDVKVFVILTPKEPFNQSTANFQAPVIINEKNRKAKQVILNNPSYKSKHPLFAEEQTQAKG